MSFKALYTDSHGNQRLLKVPWYAAFGPGPRSVSCLGPPLPLSLSELRQVQQLRACPVN
jgi:hypothetical protein